MLMSLTMRLCPGPPVDSRGTTSVVAIPTPSFDLAGGNSSAHDFDDMEKKTSHYTAVARPRRVKLPACSPEEPVWETGNESADSGFCLVELGDVAELIIS